MQVLWNLYPKPNLYWTHHTILEYQLFAAYLQTNIWPFLLCFHFIFGSSIPLVNNQKSDSPPCHMAILSHTSITKVLMILFSTHSQSLIFLTILIFISSAALVVIIFLLDHKLLCSPPGQLRFLLIRASRITYKSGASQSRLEPEGFYDMLQALFKWWWNTMESFQAHKA